MRFLIPLILLVPTFAFAQQKNYPPEFDDARAETYKTIGDVELKLWVFQPQEHQASDKRPAAIFFFGGGWKAGTPAQFEHHCRYLASRGMVAITADYRVRGRHETLADRCVADAKSAIRWLRSNASRLGVDPDRILAGGGSAGGHLAACTSVVSDLDEPSEDLTVSSKPNAMALFNPAVLIAKFGDVTLDAEKIADIADRTGVKPERISPIHQLKGKIPPTIIFHGKADPIVPYQTVDEFTKIAIANGSRCELKGYTDAAHGFFNYGRGGTPGENYLRTLQQLDQFLASIGYLSGPPEIALPESRHAHLRSGFDNARIKFEREKKGSVAFIGGSITEMNGYRPMVMQYLKERFPDTQFTFTAAGISSTCSTTGAFRLQRDVLSANPDLFFVEFAVNDDQDAAHAARECVRGMEGIVRHARSHNPNMDILMTHFVNPGMLAKLRTGKKPVSSSQHERVAAHYGVSTNYLAAELADRVNNETLTWKTFGGTHPKEPGNRLAADLVIEILESAWAKPLASDAVVTKHRMPKVMDAKSYTKGKFVPINRAVLADGWQVRKPDWNSLLGGKRERFTNQELLCATDPGAQLTLSFNGTAIAAYLLAGPDAGMLEYSIDGSEFKTIDLFHRYSKGLHYPRTVVLDADLDRGKHELVVRVSKDRNPSSKGNAARILQFGVN